MRKKNLFPGLLLLAAVATVLVYFFLVKPPVQWTQTNSLKPVQAPNPVDRGQVETLERAVAFSLEYLERLNPTVPFHYGENIYTAAEVKESLVDFAEKLERYGLEAPFFEYIEENYDFYKSGAKKVLYTGYYEARLKGSLTPSDRYRFPLYRKPGDLYRVDLSLFPFYEEAKSKHPGLPRYLKGRITGDKTLIPYFTRDEIDYQGKLADQEMEILWVDDAVEAFFLQIQGSGVVELDTGELVRVNYAESNGHPYRAIGRLLLDRNALSLEDVSMQSIRAYLEEHPEELREIFNYNPSYVFFRVVEKGPLGFIEVPLTPYRSIALDHRLFPKGGLCYIDTELPVFDDNGKLESWKRQRGFVLFQDTGGAIRTPGRLDLFTGMGDESELVAGHLKREGTFYFLVKKREPGR